MDERGDGGGVAGLRVLRGGRSERSGGIGLDVDHVYVGEVIGDERELLLDTRVLEEGCGLAVGSGEGGTGISLGLGLEKRDCRMLS